MSHDILKDPSSNDLFIGKDYSFAKTITEENNVAFGKLSEDHNPLHFSEQLASKTRFRGRIVHGMHTAALFSGVLATLTPWCVYLKQEVEFKEPVRIGDTLLARGIIEEITENGIIRVSLMASNGNGRIVAQGMAEVKKLKEMYKD